MEITKPYIILLSTGATLSLVLILFFRLSVQLAYLVVVNALTILAFWGDKQQARKGGWRMSEKGLLGFSVAGGTPAAILGIIIFKHKTKHYSFLFILAVIVAVQCWMLLQWL